MKLALVQMDIKWESKDTNYSIAEKYIKMASNESCDIVVLPEMFNTGFSMNIAAIAEDEDGETSLFLSNMARQYHINVIAGYAVREFNAEKGRNIAVVYDRKGHLVSSFVKLHPFSFAKENEHYIAGDEIVTFDIEGMSSSLFICYDLRFPEVFRRVAKKVQIIFIIANWPAARKEHWEALLKARAIENQCFIVGVNRTGQDGNGILYPGASYIFDPLGNKICQGNEDDEYLTGMINPQDVSTVRLKYPFLEDMKSIS